MNIVEDHVGWHELTYRATELRCSANYFVDRATALAERLGDAIPARREAAQEFPDVDFPEEAKVPLADFELLMVREQDRLDAFSLDDAPGSSSSELVRARNRLELAAHRLAVLETALECLENAALWIQTFAEGKGDCRVIW